MLLGGVFSSKTPLPPGVDSTQNHPVLFPLVIKIKKDLVENQGWQQETVLFIWVLGSQAYPQAVVHTSKLPLSVMKTDAHL